VKVECIFEILLGKFKSGTYFLDLDRKFQKVERITPLRGSINDLAGRHPAWRLFFYRYQSQIAPVSA
jgi:hypothetical protein